MFKQGYMTRDTSVWGSWWWTIDRLLMALILILAGVGFFLSFAASPPVATRLGLGTFYFVKRHAFFLIPSLCLIVFVSSLSIERLKIICVCGFLVTLILLVATHFVGFETKGARRWLDFGYISIQVSEFAKPFFCIVTALFLNRQALEKSSSGLYLAIFSLVSFVFLLMIQPDLGMSFIVTLTWIVQLFIAGMPLIWLAVLAGGGVMLLLCAYLFFPHVAKRFDQFFSPISQEAINDTLYQVHKSLEAFRSGGFLGKGPGEGIIKKNVPDAHADFVFAVAGEEFGFVLCMVIVILFLIFMARSLMQAARTQHLFFSIALTGLVVQFGLQAFVNIASTLHLIPTKGMTMPFISYGGSSMLALSLSLGIILNLTRKRLTLIDD